MNGQDHNLAQHMACWDFSKMDATRRTTLSTLCYCHWQGQWSAVCSQKSIDLLNAAQQTPRLYECLEINKIFSFTLHSPIALVLHKTANFPFPILHNTIRTPTYFAISSTFFPVCTAITAVSAICKYYSKLLGCNSNPHTQHFLMTAVNFLISMLFLL